MCNVRSGPANELEIVKRDRGCGFFRMGGRREITEIEPFLDFLIYKKSCYTPRRLGFRLGLYGAAGIASSETRNVRIRQEIILDPNF